MPSKMLEWLREYLQTTPIEEARKELLEIENMNIESPKAFEFIESLKSYYTLTFLEEDCESSLLEVCPQSNLDPDFSGSSFFRSIAA